MAVSMLTPGSWIGKAFGAGANFVAATAGIGLIVIESHNLAKCKQILAALSKLEEELIEMIKALEAGLAKSKYIIEALTAWQESPDSDEE